MFAIRHQQILRKENEDEQTPYQTPTSTVVNVQDQTMKHWFWIVCWIAFLISIVVCEINHTIILDSIYIIYYSMIHDMCMYTYKK